MSEPKFETYLFEYDYEGAKWSFEIKAASPADAVRRVRTLSEQGLFVGTLQFKIPAIKSFGFLPRLICGIRNLFS